MDIFKNIDMSRFVFSLQYMWKGMLCIFVVIAVIILVVYALNFFIGKIDKKKQLKEQEKENN
ncbi:MAG: OadG family protein [Clostridia bacterium]|nr:OadG family protein [Clostridia bacterium]